MVLGFNWMGWFGSCGDVRGDVLLWVELQAWGVKRPVRSTWSYVMHAATSFSNGLGKASRRALIGWQKMLGAGMRRNELSQTHIINHGRYDGRSRALGDTIPRSALRLNQLEKHGHSHRHQKKACHSYDNEDQLPSIFPLMTKVYKVLEGC